MSNPTVSFRISKYHLARALHVVRQLEPNYSLTSTSHLVKTCFFDYLAKMNLARTAEVPSEIIIELNDFLMNRSDAKSQSISLDDLIEQHEEHELNQGKKPSKDDKSDISSVSDFSPPDDWKDNNEEK